MKLHVDFLKTYLEEDIIPKGLNIDLLSTTGQDDKNIPKQMGGYFKTLLEDSRGMPCGTERDN